MQIEEQTSLVRSLLEPSPSQEFTLRRHMPDGTIKDFPLRVQMLRVDQQHAAIVAAQQYAKERGEKPGEYGDIYREGQAIELLRMALVHTEERTRHDNTRYYPPLFVDSKQARQSLTAPELAQCLNMYELVKTKFGGLEDFSEDEINLWAARLGDTMAGPLFLSRLDWSDLPRLAMSLAQRVCTLSAELGLTLPDSLGSSESDPSISDPGTTEFSSLPDAVSSDGKRLPNDRILDSDSARELLRKEDDKDPQ